MLRSYEGDKLHETPDFYVNSLCLFHTKRYIHWPAQDEFLSSESFATAYGSQNTNIQWLYFQQQFYSLVYMNISLSTLSIGEVEEVICIVPRQLVDLKLELLLVADLLATDIYEWHQVLFVPNGNCLTIWGPCDVDVLSWKIKPMILKLLAFHVQWCLYNHGNVDSLISKFVNLA